MFGKFKALSNFGKVGVVAAVLVLINMVGLASHTKTANLQSSKTGVLGDNVAASPPTSPTVTTPKPKAPAITTQTVIETQAIPFASAVVNSASLAQGTSKITTPGVNGISTLTYEITQTDGVQTAKDLISQVTTTPPVTQITSVGTHIAPTPVASSCDPNYTGCVPIASDVDCAGGSGNGPVYVQGPIRVIGTDIYGLDRDHNGIACE